jgi:hypothetical protein
VFAKACEPGLEGTVSKRAGSYRRYKSNAGSRSTPGNVMKRRQANDAHWNGGFGAHSGPSRDDHCTRDIRPSETFIAPPADYRPRP